MTKHCPLSEAEQSILIARRSAQSQAQAQAQAQSQSQALAQPHAQSQPQAIARYRSQVTPSFPLSSDFCSPAIPSSPITQLNSFNASTARFFASEATSPPTTAPMNTPFRSGMRNNYQFHPQPSPTSFTARNASPSSPPAMTFGSFASHFSGESSITDESWQDAWPSLRPASLQKQPGHVDGTHHWSQPGTFMAALGQTAFSNMSQSDFDEMQFDYCDDPNGFESASMETIHADTATDENMFSGMVLNMDMDSNISPTTDTNMDLKVESDMVVDPRNIPVTAEMYDFPSLDDTLMFSPDNTPFPLYNTIPRSVATKAFAEVGQQRPRTASDTAHSTTSQALSFEYVHYDRDTQKQISPVSPSIAGRKGRKGPLKEDQRISAALRRLSGACLNCRLRRCKCDGGDPCSACSKHFGANLRDNPCGQTAITAKIVEQTATLMPGILQWHPAEKAPEAYLTEPWEVSEELHLSPFNFGFGPNLWLQTRKIKSENPDDFRHTHVVYDKPARVGLREQKSTFNDVVLPVILGESSQDLTSHLKWQLGLLVDTHFQRYPRIESPLNVLDPVYRFYKSAKEEHRTLLGKCLRLLVLARCANDIDVEKNDPTIKDILWESLSYHGDDAITPCFVRGQLSPIVSSIGKEYMRDILLDLYKRTMKKKPVDFPVILATHSILLLVVETIQHNGCKVGYHDRMQTDYYHRLPVLLEACRAMEDSGVSKLHALYMKCFSESHKKIHSSNSNYSTSNSSDPGERFVNDLRESISIADTYIQRRARIEINVNMDLLDFSDRLLARFYLLSANDSFDKGTSLENTRHRSDTM